MVPVETETMGRRKETLSRSRAQMQGSSQLSLVEHALCPLEAQVALRKGVQHKYEYRFADKTKRICTADVRIDCANGLSPFDEFYLWGLLALTLAQPEPTFDFHATPHYCLQSLGVISSRSKGGKNYRLFRESLWRLAAVRYENNCFYDPIRCEHRQVSFGFLSYSLPLNPASSRAWRIVWDPLFFEFCRAAGSRLRFDLETYRQLDPAARRLFLLLQKIFWRRRKSPRFDVRYLAVNVLGLSATLTTRAMKAKIKRCCQVLLLHGVITMNEDTEAMFTKRGKGHYVVQFLRGVFFERRSRKPNRVDCALRDPLQAIGFDEAAINRIVHDYSADQVRLWSDVTLAAVEHKGRRFFRRSPQAFFMDNIRSAAQSGRTAPDWFHALRKREDAELADKGRRMKTDRAQPKRQATLDRAFRQHVDPESITAEMAAEFRSAGQSADVARENAQRFAAEFGRKR